MCSGLAEVLENCTRTQLAEHLADLMPAIQAALCDGDADVRAAAGGVFNTLFKSGGAGGASDSVIPALLAGLEAGEGNEGDARAARALEGLRVVLSVRPALLSAMVPRLIRPPLSAGALRALGALAEVAGPAIHGHLASVLPPLLRLAGDHPDVSPAAAAAHAALGQVVAAVAEDGLYTLVGEVERGLDDPERRRGAAAALSAFCKVTRLDYQEAVPTLIGVS